MARGVAEPVAAHYGDGMTAMTDMAAGPLPRSAPAEQDVEAAGVLALLDALEAADGIEMHSLMVLRHGTVVAEGWWAPYTAERPHLLYSLSKSFTSTAAGFAVAEGLLDLDDTVLSYFPELDADVTDPRSRSMLVRHVASMASGHDAETWDRAVAAATGRAGARLPAAAARARPGDGVRLQPAVHLHPGRDHPAPAGHDPDRLPAAAAVRPARHRRGRLAAAPGRAGPRLHRAARHHRGRRPAGPAVPAARSVGRASSCCPRTWVAEATRSHVSNAGRDRTPTGARATGSSSGWSRHGYRGDGAYGQFCLVLPEQDTVVVTTAATEDMQGILDAVWEHLLPALRPAGVRARTAPADEATLVRRLAGLQLAVPRLDPQPGSPGDWSGTTFTPTGTAVAAQPTLAAVTVEPDGPGVAARPR